MYYETNVRNYTIYCIFTIYVQCFKFLSKVLFNLMTNTLGGRIKNEYDNEMPNLKDDTLNELKDDKINTVLEKINRLRNAGMDLEDIGGKNVGFLNVATLRFLINMLRRFNLWVR